MTVAAEPVPWPNGARCAASFSFDVDAESAMLGVSTAHAGQPVRMRDAPRRGRATGNAVDLARASERPLAVRGSPEHFSQEKLRDEQDGKSSGDLAIPTGDNLRSRIQIGGTWDPAGHVCHPDLSWIFEGLEA
jgi:hypothetical protein